MAIGKKAAERQAADNTLKTQTCWGDKDIEIITKTNVTREQFKKMNLLEFMGDSLLPDFDMEIEWKVRKEERLRMKEEVVNIGKAGNMVGCFQIEEKWICVRKQLAALQQRKEL